MKVTRLVCSGCGAPLHGIRTDVVFVCSNCGAGWSAESDGLKPVEIEHRAGADSGIPLPFWKVCATVHILKRTVRNEFTSTIMSFSSRFDEAALPGKTKDTGGSSERRDFLFPAFHLDGLPGLGVILSDTFSSLPPILETGRNFPSVCGASISPRDAEVLARCVAVGRETGRSDWLAEIELVLCSVKTTLVILPCALEVEKVSIAGTGASFFRRSAPEWGLVTEYISHRA